MKGIWGTGLIALLAIAAGREARAQRQPSVLRGQALDCPGLRQRLAAVEAERRPLLDSQGEIDRRVKRLKASVGESSARLARLQQAIREHSASMRVADERLADLTRQDTRQVVRDLTALRNQLESAQRLHADGRHALAADALDGAASILDKYRLPSAGVRLAGAFGRDHLAAGDAEQAARAMALYKAVQSSGEQSPERKAWFRGRLDILAQLRAPTAQAPGHGTSEVASAIALELSERKQVPGAVIAAIVTSALTAGLLIGGTVLYGQLRGDYDELLARCAPNCRNNGIPADADRLQGFETRYAWERGLLGAGAAMVALDAILWGVGGRKLGLAARQARDESAGTIRLIPTLGGAGIQGRF